MVLTPSTATKRKNDENVSVAAPPKKARVAGNGAHAAAAVLLKTILANPKSFPAPASADAVRDALVDLAVYANALEEQNRALRVANNAKPAAPVAKAVKSKDELEVEAERIRNAAQNGIIKQMAVSPTAYSRIYAFSSSSHAHICSGNLPASKDERSGRTTASALTPRSSVCSWGSEGRRSSR